MNIHLSNALDALRKAKAQGLPSVSEIESQVVNGKSYTWSGVKSESHDHWKLTKAGEDSYWVEC